MLQQSHSGASLLPSACRALHHAFILASSAGVISAAPQQQMLPLGAAGGVQQLQQQRHKHSVRMVLLRDHANLGKQGDIVTVKSGHARYTLFPQGVADYAIPSVLRELQSRNLLSAEGLLKLRSNGRQRGSAAAAVDPAKLPQEQQLPQIIELLHSKHVVITRRFKRQHPEQMLGEVTAQHLAACTAQQLKVALPPELIMMHKHSPMTAFGSFKVPLNLKDEAGQQVELEVEVNRTRRSSRVRHHNLRLFGTQPEKSGAAAAAAAGV